jgi:hypothetical protein
MHQRWLDLMHADSWSDVPERYEPRLNGKETMGPKAGLKAA